MPFENIRSEYFEWMYSIVCPNSKYEDSIISFRKLLAYLNSIEFTYLIPKDENRAADGINLRYRFGYVTGRKGAEDYITGPCTILEMIVALAIRCEESIMADPRYGNRTSQWFWKMVLNLGLGSMTDELFDKEYVDSVISRFLSHRYAPNGQGGLFVIKNYQKDLRDIEIWHQLCLYLDTIT